MKTIAKNLVELIGNTPLVELSKFQEEDSASGAQIIAKLEYFNPAGSVKDRAALAMIESLEGEGKLQKGGTIIEPTSGNTGVGLAFIASVMGYKLILTMPESMSIERRKLLAAYGAELHLTPAAEGMSGAIRLAEKLSTDIKGSVIAGQFYNPANPEIHYRTTAEEIWRDCAGNVDILIAGVGTGGTISGTAKRLKELNPSLVAIAVEPDSSPVLSGGAASSHKIQGIGAGFIPENYNGKVVDRIIRVKNEDAFEAARRVAQSEGLLVGISSGAALSAALSVAKEEGSHNKRIVVILPDNGERYLSTELF